MSSLPGITRQDEEKRLQHTLEIAQRKVDANRQSVQALAEELHAMQEEFDENDKEAQILWHNADARFKFVNQDLRRAEQARKKPYFGRIDFRDKKLKKDEVYYIGRSVIADNPAEPEVIDWRAPIASVYYDAALGDVSYSVKGEGKYDITLSRKRTYEIENDELKDFYDSDVVANDELSGAEQKGGAGRDHCHNPAGAERSHPQKAPAQHDRTGSGGLRQDHSGHAPYFLHPVQLRAGVCTGRFLYCGKQSGALKLYNGSVTGTECLRGLPDDHGAVVRKAFVRGLGQVLADQAGGKRCDPGGEGNSCLV